MIVPLLTRRAYDFSQVSVNGCRIILVRALEVLAWRTAILLTRVHETNIPSATFRIQAYRTSPSIDSPDTDFVETTAIATNNVHAASSNSLLRDELDANFGSHIRVEMTAARGHSATILATVSVILLLLEKR